MTSDKKLYELTNFYSVEHIQTPLPSQLVFGVELYYTTLIGKNQLVRVEEKSNKSLIPIIKIELKCVGLNMETLILSVLSNMLDRDHCLLKYKNINLFQFFSQLLYLNCPM